LSSCGFAPSVVNVSVSSVQSIEFDRILRDVLMSKYRDRLRIIADILSIADSRAKKTRIMYQANLSYRLLCRYLDEVVNAGLVKAEQDDSYVLTTKGKAFLSRHEEYAKRCQSLEEHLNSVNDEKTALVRMCSGISKGKGSSNRLDKSNKRAE
jgi:predicted transcriptional regulator